MSPVMTEVGSNREWPNSSYPPWWRPIDECEHFAEQTNLSALGLAWAVVLELDATLSASGP